MAVYFTYSTHLMVKAMSEAEIEFPSTKEECMKKAGNIMVQVDFDKYRPLCEIIANLAPDYFSNKEAFFSAWVCANIKAATNVEINKTN